MRQSHDNKIVGQIKVYLLERRHVKYHFMAHIKTCVCVRARVCVCVQPPLMLKFRVNIINEQVLPTREVAC